MGAEIRLFGVWCIVTLLSVASLAAASSDLRLIDSVKKRHKEAVRSLLQHHSDVNALGCGWRDSTGMGGPPG